MAAADIFNSNDMMAGPVPPPLLLEQQQPEEVADLDQHFGQMLCKLMDGQLTAADAISQLAQRSGDVVKYYRSEASDELNAAAYRLNMANLADELEAQAASWQLLQTLYCTDQLPAGVYPGAPNVGGRPTLRQLLADTVNLDRGLRRFAHVVMWLEGLAAQKLPQTQEELQATCRFNAKDGVWRDTLRVLAGSGFGGSSAAAAGARGSDSSGSELDPDAVSRDQLKLALGDRQNDQRLVAWVWRLVRAGKFKDACELCAKAGQSWRAVSLSGAGPWGPLPVGQAAAQTAAAPPEGDAQDPSEEVACEVEAGAASARLAWRWACCAAAAAAGPSEDGGGGNRFEAALYGALCGDVRSMLPACDSWEDEAWAYCRAWLELQADAAVLQECGGRASGSTNPDPAAQAAAEEFLLGGSGGSDQGELEVPLDVLEGLVDVAAACGYSRRPSKALVKEGLGVMGGAWPLQRLALSGVGDLCLPSSFKDLYELLSTSSNSAVAAAAQHAQHTLQISLMDEDWLGLVSQLKAASGRAAAALARLQGGRGGIGQQGQQFPSAYRAGAAAAAGGGGGGDMDYAMMDESTAAGVAGRGLVMRGPDDDGDGDDVSVAGGIGGGGGGYGSSSSSSSDVPPQGLVDVLRFNAHMALALRALGQLPDPLTLQEGPQQETVIMLQMVLSEVVCTYASYLATQPDCLNLVPAYLCHLKLRERRQLTVQLLATALDMGGMEEGQGEWLVKLLSQGTEFWFSHQMALRQQQQQAMMMMGMGEEEEDTRPPHQLYGDLRPEEARLLLQYNVHQALTTTASSPKQRCDQLRWLVYSFEAAVRELQEQQQQQQQQDEDDGGDNGSSQQQQQQQLCWQGVWADALSNSLGLATQLVLNPGIGGPGVAYLMQGVMPQEFPAAVQAAAADVAAAVAAAAAAAAAGGDGGGAAAVVMSEYDSAVSSAAGVNVVQPGGQLQVQRQLLALGFWQAYAQVEGQYQEWKQSRRDEMAAAAAAGMGAAAAVEPSFAPEDAVVLVQGMLQLAEADALRLQAPPELAALLNTMSSSSSAGGAGAGGADQQQLSAAASVSEGDWLCLPQFDAPISRQVLEAIHAEGSMEQVLGLLPHNQLQLAVTVAAADGDEEGEGEGAAQGDIALPYRRLQRHELPELQSRVDAFLTAAIASTCSSSSGTSSADVTFTTHLYGSGGPDDNLAGCLGVRLNCYSRSAAGSSAAGSSSSSSRELDSREMQAWQDMVAVAVALMDAGSKHRGQGGGGGDGGDEQQGYGGVEGGGLPRLCVVFLDTGVSTQLAISRRRTTSKLLRRSAKVLSVLTRQGYRGPEVDVLLSLASQGGGENGAEQQQQGVGLLGQLSQSDAAVLLDRLTDVLAEVQDGA